MPNSCKQEKSACDAWKIVTVDGNESAETVSLPVGPLLVPVAVWQARRRELVEREYAHGWPLGVWLAAGESPDTIADDLDDFSIVAVHFPKTTDGRGCFTARRLRQRYGYRGELRAIGEVLPEQVFYLRHSGFDAFTLRAHQGARAPVSDLSDIGRVAQAAANQPLRLVRRCPVPKLPRLATARTA